ncbi:hypothetical protein [Sporomusa aerivorans]|uniref:hypothetical protein n=1 Tax=Sporomusa aerivorans TaxID=204936 RepID=UPI00352AF8C9
MEQQKIDQLTQKLQCTAIIRTRSGKAQTRLWRTVQRMPILRRNKRSLMLWEAMWRLPRSAGVQAPRAIVDRRKSKSSALYDSLSLTNIGLKYDFNSTIKLTAGVNDLFNKGPEQLWRRTGYGPLDSIGNIAYPQQDRTYYATVQYFF